MRTHDRAPSGQIPGRVGISMRRMSTTYAGEFSLTATVPFIDMPTLCARATGMLGINKDHGNTQSLRLVGNERRQLPKAPTLMLVALAFVNRYPLADHRHLFKYQCC